VELYHKGGEEVEVTFCHCEKVTNLATRQSIVARRKCTGVVGFVYGDAVDRHGLSALAMTRVEFYNEGSEEIEVTSCHCEEGTK